MNADKPDFKAALQTLKTWLTREMQRIQVLWL
jgi:hypothetical protein